MICRKEEVGLSEPRENLSNLFDVRGSPERDSIFSDQPANNLANDLTFRSHMLWTELAP